MCVERKRRRLLLVEDDEDGLILTQGLLRDIPDIRYEVEWAPSFDRGLSLLRQGGFDVCLVDFYLGEGDGLAFVRTARDAGDPTPMILLTGVSLRELDLSAMEAGASDFVEKGGLTSALLERSIRYAMQEKKALDFQLDLLQERAARAEAEAANRAKDQLLAKLSHELRTPLTAILGIASLLGEDASLPAATRARLAVLQRSAQLEARLIDDLLDSTRITRGSWGLQRERVDVAALLHQAVEISCLEARRTRNLSVEMDLQAEDHNLWGDPTRLTQVFWNLLSNAVKFTSPHGKVAVRTWSDADGWLAVEVSDDGCGIDPQELPRLFGTFEQGSAALQRGGGGLGLGLAITRAIVNAHGGNLSARSDGPGKGAAFFVFLPQTRMSEEVATPPSEPAAASPAPREAVAGTPPLHILLVEDHVDTAEALVSLLRLSGHRVIHVSSQAAALAAARSAHESAGDPLDLVISDLALGDGGSGFELMQELSRSYGLQGIALSGMGTEEAIQQSRESGFTLHVVKPIDYRSLTLAIQQVLSAGME